MIPQRIKKLRFNVHVHALIGYKFMMNGVPFADPYFSQGDPPLPEEHPLTRQEHRPAQH